MEERNTAETEDAGKKYDADKKRYDEVDRLYSKLYESFAREIIPEDKFRMLSAAYEDEQRKLKADMDAYENMIRNMRDKGNDIDDFYVLVDRYTSFEELTPQMLNEFVDKILVHKAEKIDGKRSISRQGNMSWHAERSTPKKRTKGSRQKGRLKERRRSVISTKR